jgi:putative ABC transport system permease protein
MRGDPSAAVAFLRRAKVSVDPFVANGDQIDPVTTALGIERSPSFLAVSWSLGLLQVLGILAGVLALFGMLLYLQARQRAREVAFALAVRMGLTRRDHRRSVVAEIAGLLGAAFVLGSLLAVLAAYLVHTHIAQVPGPLGVRLAVPARPFLLSAVVLAIVSAVGAWLVQRSAEHANVAEAMRRVD